MSDRHHAFQAFADGSAAVRQTWRHPWMVLRKGKNRDASDSAASDFARCQNEFFQPWIKGQAA